MGIVRRDFLKLVPGGILAIVGLPLVSGYEKIPGCPHPENIKYGVVCHTVLSDYCDFCCIDNSWGEMKWK